MGVRVVAIVTLALLILYHLLRAAATACNGSGCEIFIPISLLLPLLILIGAAWSGVLAMLAARRNRMWLIALGLCTGIAVIGPIVALIVLRDSPDAFVVSSTILVSLAPVGALVSGFARGHD